MSGWVAGGRRRVEARVVVALTVVALTLWSGPSRFADHAHARSREERPALCFLATSVQAPRRVLVGETFEAQIHVRPLCRRRTVRPVFVLAVLPSSRATPAARQALVRSLRAIVDPIVEWGGATPPYIGVVLADGKGVEACPATTDARKVRACLSRVATSAEPDPDALERVALEGKRLFSSWRPAADEVADPPSVLVIVGEQGMSTAELETSPIFSRHRCAAAMRHLHAGALRGTLRVSITLGHRGVASGGSRPCLPELATSRRFHFDERWPPGYPQGLFGPPPSFQTALVSHLDLQLAVSDDFEVLEMRTEPSGLDVAESARAIALETHFVPRAGVSLTLRLWVTAPGRHPIDGPLTLAWRETERGAGSTVRPPSRHVLALQPRRIGVSGGGWPAGDGGVGRTSGPQGRGGVDLDENNVHEERVSD